MGEMAGGGKLEHQRINSLVLSQIVIIPSQVIYIFSQVIYIFSQIINIFSQIAQISQIFLDFFTDRFSSSCKKKLRNLREINQVQRNIRNLREPLHTGLHTERAGDSSEHSSEELDDRLQRFFFHKHKKLNC